ncbi:MAG: hypothetical protein R3F43_01840 [bacterium]
MDRPVDPVLWDWFRADPNPGWNAAGAGRPGNDEYQATRAAPPPGAYDFAFRFSRDLGQTWTYCDRRRAGADKGRGWLPGGPATASSATPRPCDG